MNVTKRFVYRSKNIMKIRERKRSGCPRTVRRQMALSIDRIKQTQVKRVLHEDLGFRAYRRTCIKKAFNELETEEISRFVGAVPGKKR